MRIILLLLISWLVRYSATAQTPMPSQKEVQKQMQEAMNVLNEQITGLEKQIVEAKKNKEDSLTIKDLESQADMLKKQVQMMKGLNKSMAGISEKTFEQAVEKEVLVPKKDIARIQAIPINILSDSELQSLIRRLHADIEKLIPVQERTEAANIYRDVKIKSIFEINNAAAGCWIYGHWEKAIWLSGKACIDDMTDPDNLNNYAAFLTMIGGEHAAIPILRYLNKKYPGNSTVLNNMGQAWFGLGEIPAAKRFLDSATLFYPGHSTANLTLSNIYLSRGDSANAILALRRSFKNSFTLEKAARLESLGVELDDDDIDFDYPMEDEDPLGFEPFFDQFPPVPANVAETPMAKKQWEAFHEATNLLSENAEAESDSVSAITKKFSEKMTDPGFNKPVLILHNSNAFVKAGRKFPLAIKKRTALSIEEVMNLMAEAFHQATTNRLNELERLRREVVAQAEMDCPTINAANNSFLIRAKAIIDDGRAAMKRVYLQNKKKVHNYIKLTAYSSLNDYNERMGKFNEDIWRRNQWIYTYTANFAHAYNNLVKDPPLTSDCERTAEAPRQTRQLPSFKKPDCDYTESIALVVGAIKEECNTCTIDESRLKYKQNDLPKLEVLIAGAINISQGPLKQESMDPSKTVNIECNKSGSVKVDRGRPPGKCTVNSNRPGAVNTVTHGSIGSRLLAR